jgi:phytoene dehydrogenase-like protein
VYVTLPDYRSVSKYFKTEKLRQTFSFQTMYPGLSPYQAPAVYTLLPYTELAEDGLWFPRGGIYELIETRSYDIFVRRA